MAYRILIVDDSPIIRKMIVRILGMLPMDIGECLEAGDGQEALDVLATEWIDLMLCDVNMPRVSGEDVVRILSERDATKDLPVIIVTSDRSAAREERLMAYGVRNYVHKPVTPESLQQALVATLGRECMQGGRAA